MTIYLGRLYIVYTTKDHGHEDSEAMRYGTRVLQKTIKPKVMDFLYEAKQAWSPTQQYIIFKV